MPPLSKYRKEYHDDWAWSLAIKGATNEEIAEAFGISTRTLIRWKKDHESLDDAVTAGKHIADAKVEKALYERALGFDTTETERIVSVDKDGNPTPARVRTISKHVPPDTMAIMYWLNNRQRGTWSQRQEVSLAASSENAEDVVIFVPKMMKEEDCEMQPENEVPPEEAGALPPEG